MWKRLQVLLLCLGLAGLANQTLSAAPPATRPQVTSLVLALNDGRTYALKGDDLADDHGGVIFWNDWAVYNILYPFVLFQGDKGMKPKDLVRLWNGAAANGEQPAFLVRVNGKLCYPLNPAAPNASPQGTIFRSAVVAITVGYADGRSYSLTDLELNDERSGVLFWQDFSVNHMLVPFYAMNTTLPTTPGDVVRLWNSSSHASAQGQGNAAAASVVSEQPGFLVKPACVPAYSLAVQ
ncbi:MAG TPA: hypothetical protein VJ486_12840 [Geothrix sp.]|nr:hypothetical protein [Geothrix sp.]